jgi:hypothetical protein
MTAAAALMGASSALACVVPPSGIRDSDLQNVPEGMVAARAEIVAMNWHGVHRRRLPHSGFTLELRVHKAVANVSGDALSVEYGPCSWVPGKVGDTVPVIARRAFNGKLAAVDGNMLSRSSAR